MDLSTLSITDLLKLHGLLQYSDNSPWPKTEWTQQFELIEEKPKIFSPFNDISMLDSMLLPYNLTTNDIMVKNFQNNKNIFIGDINPSQFTFYCEKGT